MSFVGSRGGFLFAGTGFLFFINSLFSSLNFGVWFPYAQGQGHNRVKDQVMSNSSPSHNLKTTEANLMKLHRKIKHNEKVSIIQDLGCHSQSCRGHSGLKIRLCFCDYFSEYHPSSTIIKIRISNPVCSWNVFGNWGFNLLIWPWTLVWCQIRLCFCDYLNHLSEYHPFQEF